MAGWIGGNWMPPKTPSGEADLTKFGKIPVLVGGRVSGGAGVCGGWGVGVVQQLVS